MKSWNIYSKDGTLKYTAKSIEYTDEWMSSERVTMNIESEAPIYFEIGDYMTYRGLRYSIYSLPSTLKRARVNTYGGAFVWENVTFYSDVMQLTEVRFLDYVLEDNELHYSSLPTFSFYAETVDDLVDRLQANCNRDSDDWIFLTPNKERTLERYFNKASAQSLWESYYGADGENIELGKNETNVNISISENSVADGLSMIYEKFGMTYFSRDKVIVVGMSGVEASHIFTYGKGNGLYEIERVADEDQQIVTRLYAYGNDTNLPLNYYAKVNLEVFADVSNIVTSIDGTSYKTLKVFTDLQVDYMSKMFISQEMDATWSADDVYRVSVGIGGHTLEGHVNAITLNGSQYCEFSAYWKSGGADSQYSADGDELSAIISDVAVGTRIYFTAFVNKEGFPITHKDYEAKDLPNNMAVNTLMLPGFPTLSLATLCYSAYNSTTDTTTFYYRKNMFNSYNAILEVDGDRRVTFSDDRLRPYIQSPNADSLGIKEGIVKFTEENDDNGLKEIHPTIEEMTVGDVFGTSSTERLDEILSVDTISDNGVFGEDNIPNFDITIKNLGFDLEDAVANAGGSMTISLKDGYCGGRDFTVAGIKQNTDKTWTLTCNRAKDDSLGVYFPYSYNVSIGGEAKADEPYQIRTGDHFVLTGIDISDTTYVNAASVKALKKAILWLLKNDYMRYTYLPKVDDIFMAREHDQATENGTASLYETLKGGMVMKFSDSDLNVNASLFIDRITIKEGGSPIPQYEVILREEKQVGKMERVLSQASDGASSGTGGGISTAKVRALIDEVMSDNYLSRKKTDVAYGLIKFMQGLQSGDFQQGTEGAYIDSEGNAEFGSVLARLGLYVGDGTYYLDGDGLARLARLITNTIQSTDFSTGLISGSGFGIYKDNNGQTTMEVDNLIVRLRAQFNELEIRKLTYTGGAIALSPAQSSIFRVVPIDDDGNEIRQRVTMKVLKTSGGKYILHSEKVTYFNDTYTPDETELASATGWRIYLTADDGTTMTRNWWKVGDQAKCQTFNLINREEFEQSLVEQAEERYYWRLVCGVGTRILEDGKYYHYLDFYDDDASYDLTGITESSVTYNPWEESTAYAVGDQIRYEDRLYVCATAHTSGETFDSSYWTEAELTPIMRVLTAMNENGDLSFNADNTIKSPTGLQMQTTGGNSDPQVGDVIVCEGHQGIDTARMNTIKLISNDTVRGFFMYDGINGFIDIETSGSVTRQKITTDEIQFISQRFNIVSSADAGVSEPLFLFRGRWLSTSTYAYYEQVYYTVDGKTQTYYWGNANEESTEGLAPDSTDSGNYWVLMVSAGTDGNDGDPAPSYSETKYAWSAYTSASGSPSDVTGWTSAIPTADPSKPFLWMRSVTYTWSGSSYVAGAYSYARLSGEDGTGVEISGTVVAVVSSVSDLPSSANEGDLAIVKTDDNLYKYTSGSWVAESEPVTAGMGYIYSGDGHLWLWNGTDWTDCGQIKGDSGTSQYIHIAWCNTLGTGTDWTGQDTDFSTAKDPTDIYRYMGTLVNQDGNNDPDITHAGDYTWNEAKGQNAVRIDLDNEFDTVVLDEDGGIAIYPSACNARLYDGETLVPTEDVVWDGVTSSESWLMYGSAYTDYYEFTFDNDTELTAGANYATITARYNGVEYTAIWRLNFVKGDVKYDLVVSPNSIAYNTASGPSSTSVSVYIYKTTSTSTRTALTSLPSGFTLKRYAGSSTTGTNISYNSTYGCWMFNTTNASYTRYRVELTDGTNVIDAETIPINRSENGSNGDNAVSVYFDPSSIIMNQDLDDSTWTPTSASIVVMDGAEDKTSEAVFGNYSTTGTALDISQSVNVIAINGVTGNSGSESQISVPVTYNGVSYTAILRVYLNRLGTWASSVEGDVSQQISDLQDTVDTELATITTNYQSAIRQSAKDITLSVTQDKGNPNLFGMTGWADGDSANYIHNLPDLYGLCIDFTDTTEKDALITLNTTEYSATTYVLSFYAASRWGVLVTPYLLFGGTKITGTLEGTSLSYFSCTSTYVQKVFTFASTVEGTGTVQLGFEENAVSSSERMVFLKAVKLEQSAVKTSFTLSREDVDVEEGEDISPEWTETSVTEDGTEKYGYAVKTIPPASGNYTDNIKGFITVSDKTFYTLSFWAKSTADGDKIYSYIYKSRFAYRQAATNSTDQSLCDYELTSDGTTVTELTTAWKHYDLFFYTDFMRTYPEWAANTTYAQYANVQYNGTAYYCNTAHTSGSSFDSSKWTASNNVYGIIPVRTILDESTGDISICGITLQAGYVNFEREGNEYTSKISQSAREISLSINDGLSTTGINIESHTITLSADNTVVSGDLQVGGWTYNEPVEYIGYSTVRNMFNYGTLDKYYSDGTDIPNAIATPTVVHPEEPPFWRPTHEDVDYVALALPFSTNLAIYNTTSSSGDGISLASAVRTNVASHLLDYVGGETNKVYQLFANGFNLGMCYNNSRLRIISDSQKPLCLFGVRGYVSAEGDNAYSYYFMEYEPWGRRCVRWRIAFTANVAVSRDVLVNAIEENRSYFFTNPDWWCGNDDAATTIPDYTKSLSTTVGTYNATIRCENVLDSNYWMTMYDRSIADYIDDWSSNGFTPFPILSSGSYMILECKMKNGCVYWDIIDEGGYEL